MEVALPIILFVIGFGVGRLWFGRSKRRSSRSVSVPRRNWNRRSATFHAKPSRKAKPSFSNWPGANFQKLEQSSGQQLEQKKELIDSSLKTISSTVQQLNEGTARLHGSVESTTRRLDNLTQTTDQLRQILSSSQARGQWERMVEDI